MSDAMQPSTPANAGVAVSDDLPVPDAPAMLGDAGASMRSKNISDSALAVVEALHAQAIDAATAAPSAVQTSEALLSTAIDACATEGHWEVCLAMLSGMRRASLAPTGAAAGKFLAACERAELYVRSLRMQLASRPLQTRGGSKLRLPPAAQDDVPLHFCFFQADLQGLSGWSLERGGSANRWDVLLDGLLKCFMMDGEWPREVCASVFVGPDAVHLNGDVQHLVMPIVGRREDKRPMYQPATFKAFEEALWRARGADFPGVSWRHGAPPSTREGAKAGVIAQLDEVLAGAPADATVLVFAAAGSNDVTYDTLCLLGEGGTVDCSRAYIVMAGAGGFDGDGDSDGGAFLEEVLARFAARLGRRRVARVSLCGEGEEPVALPPSQIASFVSVEYVRGSLGTALSGVSHLEAKAV